MQQVPNIHQRQCSGPPEEERGEFRCKECTRRFNSLIGLQVHRASINQLEYQSEIEVIEKGPANWSEQEKLELARAEVDVIRTGTREGNIEIQKKIQTRSTQAQHNILIYLKFN